MRFSRLVLIVLVTALVPAFEIHAATVKAPTNNGLVGYWSFNEATGTIAHDFSGNGDNMSTTSLQWTPGARGSAVSFDGSSFYLDAGNPAPLNIPTGGSVTMCAWVYDNTGSTGTFQGIMAKRGGTSPPYAYGINFITNNFQIYTSGTSGIQAFAYNLPAKQWTHICGAISSSPTALYVNGVLFGTLGPGGGVASNTNTFHVGSSLTSGAAEYFNGKIDEVRVYNRALSASEVQALYQQGATRLKLPNNLGLVDYFSFNEATGTVAHDFSGYRNSGTLSGATDLPVWQGGKLGNGALSFDGTDDYVSVPNSPSLQPLSGNWAVSFWIYRTGTGAGDYPQVIGSRPWTLALDKGWAVSYSTGSGKIGAHYADGSTGFDVTATQSASTVPLNTWQHWAVVFDRTNGKLNYYLNGQLDIQQTPTFPSGIINQTDAENIGREIGGSNTRRLAAVLDEIRVYNRTLSATDVQQLYNSGAALHNASRNSYLTNGLIGLWSFDGKDMNWAAGLAYDRSGSGNSGTLTNLGTTTSPTPGKIGQALRFNGNGSNQYVVVTSPPVAPPSGSAARTIAGWVKTNGTILTRTAYFGYGGTGTDTSFIFESGVGGDGKDWFVNYNDDLTGTKMIGDGKWHHVAVTYDGTLESMYVDGALDVSAVKSLNTSNLSLYPMTIGRQAYNDSGGNPYQSQQITTDDVRLYNRALSATEVKQLYNSGR